MKRTEHTPPERRASAVVIPFPRPARPRDGQARLQDAVRQMEAALAVQLTAARGFQETTGALKLTMSELCATLREYKRRLRVAEAELHVTTAHSRCLAGLMDDWAAAAARA